MPFDHLYIGGEWVRPTLEPIVVRSPHDGSIVAEAAAASIHDVDRAVAAARHAFDHGPWPRLDPADRIAAVERLAAAYAERLDELAELITRQNGSPLLFSQMGQVGGIATMIDGFLAAARATAWHQPLDGVYGRYEIVREPVGVVAAIPAFNVPQVITIGKLIPALLAGCTVVVKPSPEVPLDALVLAEIVDGAGLPEGVVSILPGGPEAGRHLVGHPDVDMVTFTGSTPVGREIGRVCGEQMKRMALELGGKSAAIVLDDADAARTAAGLRFASFINNGQACAAQTRVLAPRARYAEIVDALEAAVTTFAIGDPLDLSTEIGPVVNGRQRDKVLAFIESGLAEGARVAIGGTAPIDGLEAGSYVRPTLLVDARNDMRIAQDEIFGPVLTVIAYDDEDEAVRLANDSPFGLAGSVWTADAEHGRQIGLRVRTGTFGINRYGPDPTTPFGGFKASGIGREYGAAGLDEFVEIKTLHGAGIGIGVDRMTVIDPEGTAVDDLRRELRVWLDANLTPDVVDAASRPVGEDNLAVLRAWNRRLVDGGWAAPSWPVEHGGRGAGVAEQVAYLEEMNRVRAPGPVNVIGVANIAPAIMHFGTEEQKARFLGPMLRGDEIWSQGMSEPDAGSDLASLRTSAVVDGDEFVINGQKTWNSMGHFADWCQLYVRTDPTAPQAPGDHLLPRRPAHARHRGPPAEDHHR